MKSALLLVIAVLLVITTPAVLAQTDTEGEVLTGVPMAPTNFVATTSLPIDLSWTASDDPSSDTPVTHYSIERSDDGVTWYVLSANIDITKPYNHEKAVTINYVDSNITIGNVYDYRIKAHNIIGESLPSSISSAKAVIQTSDKVITFGQRVGEIPSIDLHQDDTELVSLTDFEKTYVLTKDEIREIFDWRWEIIQTENELDNTETDIRSSEIILKDASQFFEPIYKKLKLSSITIEVYQFDYESDQKEFWQIRDYDKTIFDIASKTGFSETTGTCFFENSDQGGISGCSYDDIIIQVTIFDPYMQNYRYNDFRYNENDSSLKSEPTLKIVNKILEKINNFKNRSHGDVVDVLRSGQLQNNMLKDYSELDNHNSESDYLDMEAVSRSQINWESDPEKAIKAGINHFTCKKDDFGIVSIAGEFMNGVGFVNNAKITVSLIDENEDEIITDSNNFHNVDKYDTRKFVAYIKTDEKFYDCTVEITSDDGLLKYKTSLFLN